MGLLVNKEIREMLGDAVVIHPFHEEQLNTNSYDLCLGEHFWRPKEMRIVPNLAKDRAIYEYGNAGSNNGSIRLGPGEFVLAHSQEFAGGRVAASGGYPYAVTTRLAATSTARRLCLSVCACAGLGDVGYFNRWTYELHNDGPNVVDVPVGAILAQLTFELVEVPDRGSSYGEGRPAAHGRARDGYQQPGSLEEIMAAWTPDSMLPRTLKVPQWAAWEPKTSSR